MICVIYLNAAKQVKEIIFENYNEFVRAQQACWIDLPDHTRVQKVTYKGHDLDFQGLYGELYFYLMKQDLSQYD